MRVRAHTSALHGPAGMSVAFLLALLIGASAMAEDVVRLDVTRAAHTYMGFGANIWPGDLAVEKAIADIGMTWVRLWAGCPENPPGTDATREEFDAYWRRHPGNDQLRKTATMIARRKLKTVLCVGSPPSAWLGPGHVLKPEYHGAFARMWGSAVLVHREAGISPTYIELYNEPDGFWGIHVSPSVNAKLTRMVRAELDARGFRDVGICGPGTAHADWGEVGDQYVNAMDAAAVGALAAWSNHAWEWKPDRIHADNGHAYLREEWPSVMDAIRRKDPGPKRPVIVTEFATKAYVFHGTRYVDQGAGRSVLCASDTASYAARVVTNAIHLLNGGANALIVWEGADQSWSNHEWGLMTRPERGSRPRPVYHALAAAFSTVPVGARILRQDGDTGCAVVGLRKGETIVFVAANGTSRDRSVRIPVTGAWQLRRRTLRAFGGATCAVADAEITLRLPRDAVISVSVTAGRRPQAAGRKPTRS